MADGSSLFLDEIANVPLGQQQKLLRVLETGEFERLGSSRTRKADVPLDLGHHADLNAEVAPGRSGRICSSDSIRSRSTCRRCAIGARTSRAWPAF